jgi:pimeloyl-ACP methyl ester carboxylesterase
MRLKHSFVRILLVLTVAVILSAISGAAFQAFADRRGLSQFAPPGKLVNVAGRLMHLYCTGEGAPTVILEHGLGLLSSEWALVQPRLAKFTRVCSYDRAGYAWSDPGPDSRTSGRIAEELHQLLSISGISGPYILAGHSFGGFNVRVFRSRHPEEVVGVLLVDSSQEDQVALMPEVLKRAESQLNSPVLMALIRLGFARWGPTLLPNPQGLPPAIAAATSELTKQTRFWKVGGSEYSSFEESAVEARASGSLGDLPLIVLTAGRIQAFQGNWVSAEMKAANEEFHDKVWVPVLQTRLAHLSSRSKQLVWIATISFR